MFIRISIIALLLFIVTIIPAEIGENHSLAGSQKLEITPKNRVVTQEVLHLLKRLHYDPMPMNDELSMRIYGLYLERLDRNKRFFIESDIKELSSYERSIDDMLVSSDPEQ
ncbi:MAG: hypothetical protein K8S56_02100, partial [Candidatus Cloacimonetes bacterium]|nr:hypothetical protein [Candidatus Cloacimonadota bacterium]